MAKKKMAKLARSLSAEPQDFVRVTHWSVSQWDAEVRRDEFKRLGATRITMKLVTTGLYCVRGTMTVKQMGRLVKLEIRPIPRRTTRTLDTQWGQR